MQDRNAVPTEAMVEAALAVTFSSVCLPAYECLDESDVRELLSAALAHPQVREIAIKPLEWVDDDWREARWTAKTPFGDEYGIGKNEGVIEDGRLKRFVLWLPQGEKGIGYTSLAEAKAFAQADYERLIRSALAPLDLHGCQANGVDRHETGNVEDNAPVQDPVDEAEKVELMVKSLRDPFPAEYLTVYGGIDRWREIMRNALRSLSPFPSIPEEKGTAPVENRPEWIWYCESTSGVPVVTFGRWAKHPQQARYKLAEIQPTEHDHPTTKKERKTAGLPPIGDELYDHYVSMSAQTHEALVKEYARKAVRAALSPAPEGSTE